MTRSIRFGLLAGLLALLLSAAPALAQTGTPTITNYVWLDENTLGFLATNPTPGQGGFVTLGFDRRTGELRTDQSRLAGALPFLGVKQIPVLFSPDGRRLLVADTTDAKPLFSAQGLASFGGTPEDALKASRQAPYRARFAAAFAADAGFRARADAALAFEPLPGLARFIVTEGARFLEHRQPDHGGRGEHTRQAVRPALPAVPQRLPLGR